jgi:hypothetical protein
MSMTKSLIFPTITINIILIALTCHGDEPGREEIRRILQSLWQSYETIEFDASETFIGSGGMPRFEDRIHYVFGSGGRRAWEFERQADDGEEISVSATRQREDGQYRYVITNFPGDPDLTDRLVIEPQENSPEDFKGLLPRAFFAITPFGRPLYRFADEQASIRPVREGGDACYELSFPYRDSRVRCVLDPQHGWLARRVTADDGSLDIIVTRFQNDQGLWFPAEGSGETRIGEEPNRKPASLSFTTSDLRINRDVAPGAFGVPKLPDGTKIVDRRTGKTTIQGRGRDRSSLIRTHRERSLDRLRRSAESGRAVRAMESPPSWPWRGILAASALVCFTTAVTLRLRDRRRGRDS